MLAMQERSVSGPTVNQVQLAIRWRDLDAYGHVNNAVYLTYLEECRDGCVAAVLGPIADTWEFVLAHVGIDYRHELRLEDRAVVVRCWIESFGRSSVRTREEIRKLDGSLAAEASSVVVPRDPAGSGSRPLTDEERAALTRATGGGP
jgi:acyl-CoA thioester hydrolase